MARPNPPTDWARLMIEASRLWADVGTVVVLRSWRVMGGGATAQREIEQMVTEKVAAGFELAGVLASGAVKSPEAAARKALGIYGRRIRGNRKRLGVENKR